MPQVNVASSPMLSGCLPQALLGRKALPDMGRMADVAEFLTRSGYGSVSAPRPAPASWPSMLLVAAADDAIRAQRPAAGRPLLPLLPPLLPPPLPLATGTAQSSRAAQMAMVKAGLGAPLPAGPKPAAITVAPPHNASG